MTTSIPVIYCEHCYLPKAAARQWLDDPKHGDGHGCACDECCATCWDQCEAMRPMLLASQRSLAMKIRGLD